MKFRKVFSGKRFFTESSVTKLRGEEGKLFKYRSGGSIFQTLVNVCFHKLVATERCFFYIFYNHWNFLDDIQLVFEDLPLRVFCQHAPECLTYISRLLRKKRAGKVIRQDLERRETRLDTKGCVASSPVRYRLETIFLTK